MKFQIYAFLCKVTSLFWKKDHTFDTVQEQFKDKEHGLSYNIGKEQVISIHFTLINVIRKN